MAETLPAARHGGQSTLVYARSTGVGIAPAAGAGMIGGVLRQETIVPAPWWGRVLVWLCLPLAGAALLWGVLRLIEWLPIGGPFTLLRRLPSPWDLVAALAIGAVIGLILAALADAESLTVRITPLEVVLTRPGRRRVVPRGDVAVAFPDRDQLVLLGRTGRELGREPCHLSRSRLSEAFRAHGIAWAEQDPYLQAYRRWVPGLLPPDAEALLTARQKALRSGDDEDVRELREELGRLGYVLRDEKKRQYWRQVS
ncbi:YqeB family protein [Actinoplanes sp. URMC 104]|uniref:YqeB family protein n=1 Tax=Actinoplanes sp. URMC 104 TaxID=3423409 RepID=UPI003F1D709C